MVKFGSMLAIGDPDLGTGRMQLLFRRAHVGPLLDELGRHAQGQVRRQVQIGKLEDFRRRFARRPSRQRRQQVTLHGERLAQRRQRCRQCRQVGLLQGNFDAACPAVLELVTDGL